MTFAVCGMKNRSHIVTCWSNTTLQTRAFFIITDHHFSFFDFEMYYVVLSTNACIYSSNISVSFHTSPETCVNFNRLSGSFKNVWFFLFFWRRYFSG